VAAQLAASQERLSSVSKQVRFSIAMLSITLHCSWILSYIGFSRKAHRRICQGTILNEGTMLQVGRSRDRVPMGWIFFSNLPNPSGRTMALGSTQPLTEMSTRYLKKET
jgi:hypothetical protein